MLRFISYVGSSRSEHWIIICLTLYVSAAVHIFTYTKASTMTKLAFVHSAQINGTNEIWWREWKEEKKNTKQKTWKWIEFFGCIAAKILLLLFNRHAVYGFSVSFHSRLFCRCVTEVFGLFMIAACASNYTIFWVEARRHRFNGSGTSSFHKT